MGGHSMMVSPVSGPQQALAYFQAASYIVLVTYVVLFGNVICYHLCREHTTWSGVP